MKQPKPITGLRHVALRVQNLQACAEFYTKLLGMRIEWQPDAENIYLTSGCDNLALHQASPDDAFTGTQRLDHIGFIIESPEEVDIWYEFLRAHQVEMKMAPKTHRDGARSFYCLDPDGNAIQIIYHPPIARILP